MPEAWQPGRLHEVIHLSTDYLLYELNCLSKVQQQWLLVDAADRLPKARKHPPLVHEEGVLSETQKLVHIHEVVEELFQKALSAQGGIVSFVLYWLN